MRTTTVCFDVGETLVNEARLWRLWARWLNVRPEEFFAALADVIDRREHHHRVFDRFRPGFDLADARRERAVRGWPPDSFDTGDLYPDVVPCLTALRRAGYCIGIAGNQPAASEEALRHLRLPVHFIGSSERWGVEKPSVAFFHRLQKEAAVPGSGIVYVGDRLDGDILPALEAGLSAVLIERGPWGVVHARWPDASKATLRLPNLEELPAALERLGMGAK